MMPGIACVSTVLTVVIQMSFPVEDVIRNIRHFLSAVKDVTGNSVGKSEQQPAGGPSKPGE